MAAASAANDRNEEHKHIIRNFGVFDLSKEAASLVERGECNSDKLREPGWAVNNAAVNKGQPARIFGGKGKSGAEGRDVVVLRH